MVQFAICLFTNNTIYRLTLTINTSDALKTTKSTWYEFKKKNASQFSKKNKQNIKNIPNSSNRMRPFSTRLKTTRSHWSITFASPWRGQPRRGRKVAKCVYVGRKKSRFVRRYMADSSAY